MNVLYNYSAEKGFKKLAIQNNLTFLIFIFVINIFSIWYKVFLTFYVIYRYVGKDKCVPLTNCVQEWIDLGANYIGGCCRTGPDDTKAFRQYIDNLKNSL